LKKSVDAVEDRRERIGVSVLPQNAVRDAIGGTSDIRKMWRNRARLILHVGSWVAILASQNDPKSSIPS
jgi:hypothetical protein